MSSYASTLLCKEGYRGILLLTLRGGGGMLSRQSDLDFPISKFETGILNTKKKYSGDCHGMFLSILVSILSDRGREILLYNIQMNKEQIYDEV